MQRFTNSYNAKKYLLKHGFSVEAYTIRSRQHVRFHINYNCQYLGSGYTSEDVARFATAFMLGRESVTNKPVYETTIGEQYPDWL